MVPLEKGLGPELLYIFDEALDKLSYIQLLHNSVTLLLNTRVQSEPRPFGPMNCVIWLLNKFLKD
jgi:hypothetical protein